VSIEDAEKFCCWAGLSLPSLDLWKAFTLAGSDRRYWWGDKDDVMEKVSWYEKNSNGKPQPVGKKRPNTWGLFDVYGNVWEWTEKYSEQASDPRDLRGERNGMVSWKAKVCGGAFDQPGSSQGAQWEVDTLPNPLDAIQQR
jgi:formylglycine-generating enzyme required for sulfatase activity